MKEMKALIFSLGTRGDIEPFLAIGQMLQKRKWEVVCVFPEQFREITENAGFPFFGFSKRFLELMDGTAGTNAMGGKGFLRRFFGIVRMFIKSGSVQKILVEQQFELIEKERPDLVIYSGICAYPVIWGMAHPGKSVMVSPVPCFIHPVNEWAMQGIRGNWGPLLNKLTYQVFNWILFGNIYRTTKKYHFHFKGLQLSPRHIEKHFMHHEKLLYSVSPTLFPRPGYWPEKVQVIGLLEREQKQDWQPGEKLKTFLSTYSKILFITFGSMINPDPESKTQIIVDLLVKHQIPAIINTSFGGLKKLADAPAHVFFVEDIPYDWVFPHVYAVIHHGGSGTTHTALKYGCASMIVPHILDQYYWHDLLVKLGAGPNGFPVYKLTKEQLEPRLLDLYRNERYKEKAIEISRKMAAEKHPFLYDLLLGRY